MSKGSQWQWSNACIGNQTVDVERSPATDFAARSSASMAVLGVCAARDAEGLWLAGTLRWTRRGSGQRYGKGRPARLAATKEMVAMLGVHRQTGRRTQRASKP